MAHELTASDHMVSGNNTTPWHGLGTVLPGHLTAHEALTAAKLDWQVEQSPVFDGDMVEIKTHRLNRRSDNRENLGVVRQGWEPVQNERLLEIAEALAQIDDTEFRPVVETAGSLKGGQIVWALVRVGERTFADSPHTTYLLLSNGHDGLRALRGTLTDTRVVCANTLRLAETSVSNLYVSHARGVDARINTALKTLGWANEATRATFAIYQALSAVKVPLDQARATFRRLVIGANEAATKKETATIDQMTELFRSGRGNSGATAFDVLNAVTDWADHGKTYRDDDRTAERRFLSASFGGDADRLKSAAYEATRTLAGV